MLAALLGKPVEDLTVGDLQAMDMAQYAAMVGQIEALPETERQRVVAHCSSLYAQWELARKQGELEVDRTEFRAEQLNHSTRSLQEAMDDLNHSQAARCKSARSIDSADFNRIKRIPRRSASKPHAD
ncbi:hypothetical protein [Nitrospirillum sp. BR 11163]|uniref:hypothetical protein n=1 Tax=Nitrospirillum sp. BR 11163 TaxID=3104323 RepID=UPI002AFF2033|nr:hypothetical protein [Nitrospirillum sp. BR 11163]MEA1671890.1 hypothetical protein [Nitrospirillum sp. BR 11163]